MVTPKMKLYRLEDDEDKLEEELSSINEKCKKLYIDLRYKKDE